MKLEVKTLNSSQFPTSNHIDILQYPAIDTFLQDLIALKDILLTFAIEDISVFRHVFMY